MRMAQGGGFYTVFFILAIRPHPEQEQTGLVRAALLDLALLLYGTVHYCAVCCHPFPAAGLP
jgi:hypothetical protein